MAIKKIKTILLGVIVFLSCLIFIQACEKSGSLGSAETLLLTENETKTAAFEGEKIAITATNFTDSRCPVNADCVWSGYAMLKVNFKEENKEQDITMCIGACEILSVNLPNTIILNGKTYKIKLQEVTPYPTLNKSVSEPSKAKIIITK
ncbi:hypothetical protein [Pedobacter insulae]|uniref:Lipoprotein n=1 Tax=Pedobacter insulae TaxID=414048 RepID=A0A1I2UB47_9SPHI|nr:hypothetical protein [Pedobacter insulae]SFG74364.1 hypothetical protein SAMN04489864_10266 [Pedobacter insulae]